MLFLSMSSMSSISSMSSTYELNAAVARRPASCVNVCRRRRRSPDGATGAAMIDVWPEVSATKVRSRVLSNGVRLSCPAVTAVWLPGRSAVLYHRLGGPLVAVAG